MSLKNKLYTLVILLHSLIFALGLIFREELGVWLIAFEFVLLCSLFSFLWLLRKALQPLEYIHIFSSLLREQEFTSHFSALNQPELDKLIETFNRMLDKLHQERLSFGERKHVFEKLMEESPVGVILLDFDNRISECNHAAKVLLQGFDGNLAAEGKERLPPNAGELNHFFGLNEIEVNQQQLVTTTAGSRLKIGHFQFRDRGFNRSFYLIQEITLDILRSQKESYEKLIRLMSHEVNNTIAITNSLLHSCLNFQNELLPDSKKDFEQAIKVVIGRSASLNQFMKGYADVVRVPKPRKSKFDLTRLIRNLKSLYFTECQQHKIILNDTIDNDVSVIADPHLIEQVLINIIKNSIEAIERDGIIEFSVTQGDSVTEVIIKDSGCGIDDAIKHQLFTPFFTTKETGQGVGLMLIDEILTAHGFPYKLANNNEQPGAFFAIEFSGAN